MPEDEKKEEKQEQMPADPEEAQEDPNNGAPTAQDIAAIKAQLEEEKEAKAAAEAALGEKDTLIADLQAQLSEAKRGSEVAAAELTQARDARSKAVAKYLEAVKLANPAIPSDVITGSTIEEVDASVDKAKAIADSMKKALEAQAKEARVPAGAPARGEISVEGLSPREKIAAGLNQKGGT